MKEAAVQQYVVDAFTDRVFSGNPAAVCVLEEWLPDALMQSIARENNLSETAFTVRQGGEYTLRWFTPGGEIDLCGHATLACAHVLFSTDAKDSERLVFSTQSGALTVSRRGELYEMDFPAYALAPAAVTPAMTAVLGVQPREAYLGRDLLCVLESAEQVRALAPDQKALKALDGLLVHVTAPGDGGYDCCSRSFAPKLGVPEDPVCGSGHCHIAPYWCARLDRKEIVAYQASARGGTLYCRLMGGRVALAGKAVLFSRAALFLPTSSGPQA